MSLSGSIVASDWQSLKGDPCDQFSEGNSDTDANGCQGSIEIILAAAINAEALTCSNVYSPPIEMKKLRLELYGGCGNCTPHTTFLTQIVTNDIYDFICLSNSNSHELQCYWQERDTCLNLTVSNSGSTLLYNDSKVMSDSLIECNSSISTITSLPEENALLILLSIDNNNTVNCLNAICWPNRYEYCDHNPSDCGYMYNITTTKENCDCNSSYICETNSGPPYNCFWNPNSRITGKYCPRCEPLCRSTDHSLNFIQFIVGVSLITASWPMSRTALSLLASDAMGTTSQVSIVAAVCACMLVRIYVKH